MVVVVEEDSGGSVAAEVSTGSNLDDEASSDDGVAALPTRQRSRGLRRGRSYLTYDRLGENRVARFTLMAVEHK